MSVRDVIPGGIKESHRDYDPDVAARRRSGWEQSLATAHRYDQPTRWNDVYRELAR